MAYQLASTLFDPLGPFLQLIVCMNNARFWQEILRRVRHHPDAPEFHVAKASADSHSRREHAIRAKRQQDEAERDGASKSGAFKPW